MSEERNRPVWPWLTIAMVTLLVAYPLSFGPASWLTNHKRPPGLIGHLIEYFYTPVFLIVQHAPVQIQELFKWYLDLWR
jgi:hypothetical protein